MPTYNDALSKYITETFAQEDDALAAIRKQIPERGLPEIMIRPEEAAFLQFLVAATGARSVVEIGTLGGYSGSWMARALPIGGKLITLEARAEACRCRTRALRLGRRGRQGRHPPGRRPRGPALPWPVRDLSTSSSSTPRRKATWTTSIGPWPTCEREACLAAHNAFRGGRVVGRS